MIQRQQQCDKSLMQGRYMYIDQRYVQAEEQTLTVTIKEEKRMQYQRVFGS